jgi:cell division protein FtsQ
MRQVKAQASGHGRPARPQGRSGKAAGHRAPQVRAGKRNGREKRRFDPEGTLAALRETWAFRHPMLSLTLGLLAFGVIGGLISGGYIAKGGAQFGATAQHALADAGFAVRQVHLSGNERTTEDEAFGALDVTAGYSIFSVDPSAARKRLLALPWVADAEVRRQFPDTVTVRLIEKRPFALWRNGRDMSVVERSGAVITREGLDSFHLPVIAGAGAPGVAAPFLDVLGGYKAVFTRVRMIERMGERRWDLKLDGNVTVRLPEEGWEDQLKELDTLISKRGVLDRDIEIIDLRYPDNYVFKLHNGDSRPLPRQQRA